MKSLITSTISDPNFNINSNSFYAHWCKITTPNPIGEENSTINLRRSRLISAIYDFFIVFKFYFSSAADGNGIVGIAVGALLN